jgi:hypothetical protein
MEKKARQLQLNLSFYIEHHDDIRQLAQRLRIEPHFIEQLRDILSRPMTPALPSLEQRLKWALAEIDRAKDDLRREIIAEVREEIATEIKLGHSHVSPPSWDALASKGLDSSEQPQHSPLPQSSGIQTDPPDEDKLPIEDEYIDRRQRQPRIKPAGAAEINRRIASRQTDQQIANAFGLRRETIGKWRRNLEKQKAEQQQEPPENPDQS